MTSDELAAFARRLFDAYGAGDLNGFRALLADDLIACGHERRRRR